MLIIIQATFAMACFLTLSIIQECLGGHQMAPPSLQKQIIGCKLPHDWLVRMAMDLGYVELEMASDDANLLPLVVPKLCLPLHEYLPTPTLLPYRSPSGIGYSSINYMYLK